MVKWIEINDLKFHDLLLREVQLGCWLCFVSIFFWSFVILPSFKCNWVEEKYSYRNDWKNAKQKHVSLLLTFLLNRAFSCFFSSFSSSSKSDENMCALTGNWSTCGISFGSLSQLLFFFRFSKNRHVHVHSVYVFQLQICSITTNFQAPNYMSNHVCFSVYQMQNSFTKHSRISKTYRDVFGVFFPFQFDWTAIFNVLRKRTHQMCGWLLFFRYFYVSEWVSVCVRSFPSVKIDVTNASMFVRMYSWLECGTKIYDQYFF